MGTITKVTAGGATHLVASSAYGTCATAAETVAKVVTMSDFDTLIPGMTIHVYFTYSNTAASPTLNVNSTGVKPIYKYGTTVPGTTAATSWQAGSIVSFTYNTTANSSGCWMMNDHLDDTNTDTKVTQSNIEDDANYRILLSENANNTTETETTKKSGNLVFNPSKGQLVIYNNNKNYPGLYVDVLETPQAGENINILTTRFKNTEETQTYVVHPIGILGTDRSDEAYNGGIRIGSDTGTTVIGAGESSSTFAQQFSKYDNENLYLTADGKIYMYTGLENSSSNGQWLCGGYTSTPISGQVIISDGTNGGYKTSGYTIAKSVPSNALFTDTTYSTATTSSDGLMSSTDKANLNTLMGDHYGQTQTNFDQVSVPADGTMTQAGAITIPEAGTFLIIAYGSFVSLPKSAYSVRMCIAGSTAPTSLGRHVTKSFPVDTNTATSSQYEQLCRVVTTTSATNYYLWATQKSDTAINFAGGYYLIRIK